MSQLFIDNAISWAHFRLLGGWNRLLWLTAIFALVFIVALAAPSTLVRMVAPGLQGYLLHALIAFEMALAVLIAPALTSAAIRRDMKDRMLESHRLMPVSNSEVIAGYIIGPNAFSMSLFLAAIVCGTVAAVASGIAIPRFLIASGIVMSFGAFMTVLAACESIAPTRTAGIWLILGFVPAVFGTTSQWAQVVPAATVFCGPLMRKTVFSMQAGVDEPLAYVVSELFQIVAGVVLFVVAGRRYRSAGAASFSLPLALAPMAILIAASAFGMRRWNLFYWQAFASDRPDRFLQWAVAAGVALFLSTNVVTSSDRARFVWTVRRAIRSDSPEKAPTPAAWVMLCCVLMILLLGPLALPDQWTNQKAVPIALISLCSLLSIHCYYKLFLTSRQSGIWNLLFLAMTWGGPPLVLLGLNSLADAGIHPLGRVFPPIDACSPPVAFYYVWKTPLLSIKWEIFVQMLTAAILALIVYAGHLRRDKTGRP